MKSLPLALITAGVFIAGGIYMGFSQFSSDAVSQTDVSTVPGKPTGNVTIVDGVQIITLTAKGGFEPRKSVAHKGVPTIIRFSTNNTFDCSSDVVIPSLGIRKVLPQTGMTDVAIGNPETTRLTGTCGMGMYPFEVIFAS